jgi:hypothetical protein
VRVIARQYREDAARRRADEGQGGHVRAQRAGQHPGHQRDGVAGRDQGDLAVQVGGVEVNAGDGAGPRRVLPQQGRGSLVVLGPGLVGQRLDPDRRAAGQAVAGRDHDDHLVGSEELALKAGAAGQPGRRVGHDRDVELPADRALVQLTGETGHQAPRQRPGLVEQAAHRGGHHAGRQGRRRADRQRAGRRSVAGVAGGPDGAFRLVDRGLRVVPERLARGRGPDAARVPFQQRRADLALQPGDLP